MTILPALPILDLPPPPPWLAATRRPFHDTLYALYSHAAGGVITEPLWMQLPADDHLVHRGDGVFETIKCVDGRLYCLDQHLDRLAASAHAIGLASPLPPDALADRILATVRTAGRRDALIRVLLSRGPGSMGINPYDCPTPGLYILVHQTAPPFMETHPEGARLITSTLPLKPGLLATIKSCNYLPNALLKKEAVDRGAHFAVTFDERGFLAEGATENIGIVTPERLLAVPRPGRILPGTTLHRALDLAASLVARGDLNAVAERDLSPDTLHHAREILIFGTTTNVTAVTRLDESPVGPGTPGPIAIALNHLLVTEQHTSNPYTTPAFPGLT
jgi:branched-chain amino acid aminotransferase